MSIIELLEKQSTIVEMNPSEIQKKLKSIRSTMTVLSDLPDEYIISGKYKIDKMKILETICMTQILLEDGFKKNISTTFENSLSGVYTNGELHKNEFEKFIISMLPNTNRIGVEKYWKMCFPSTGAIPQFSSIPLMQINKLVNNCPEFRKHFREIYVP